MHLYHCCHFTTITIVSSPLPLPLPPPSHLHFTAIPLPYHFALISPPMPSLHHHDYHTSTITNNYCHPLSHHHRHLVNYDITTATLPHLLRYHQFTNTTTALLALNHLHHLFISYTTIISPPLLFHQTTTTNTITNWEYSTTANHTLSL